MQHRQQFCILLGGSITTALGDSLLKGVGSSGKGRKKMFSDFTTRIAVLLYIAQIIIFFYLFTEKRDLGIVGNVQVLVYSLLTTSIGIIWYKEGYSRHKIAGICLCIAAVFLLQ